MDVSVFPREFRYAGVNLADELDMLLRPAVPAWQEHKVITASNDAGEPYDSFGLAAANPFLTPDQWRLRCNDPQALIGFVYGWGPTMDEKISNAIRKVMAAARVGKDTIDIPPASELWLPDDFQHPGACFSRLGHRHPQLIGSSGVKGPEDHALSALAGNLMSYWMERADNTAY